MQSVVLGCVNHPNEGAEWLEIYCQECWESYCSGCWHELLKTLSPTNEMKKPITGPCS